MFEAEASRRTKSLDRAHPTFWLIIITCLILVLSSFQVWADDDDSTFEEFVNGAGEMLYFLAWPTAEYEHASLGGVSRVADGVDISIKLHGKSAFSGGHLWAEVVVEIRDGAVKDLRWGQHNGILAPPGQTITAFGEALQELNNEYSQSGGSSFQSGTSPPSQSGGYPFFFENNCDRTVRVAIRYRDVGGYWKTVGWWKFAPGKSSYLASNGKRLLTKNTIWYYYAEATDGSGYYWGGDYPVDYNGTKLEMKKLRDDEGDSNWSIVCNQ